MKRAAVRIVSRETSGPTARSQRQSRRLGRPGRRGTHLWPLLLLLSILLSAAHLWAASTDVSPEEKAAAREAATAGIRAFQEADYDTALDLLRKAEQIMHAPPHLIYIARAHVGKGELVLAREALMTLVNEVLPPDAPSAFHDAQAAGVALKAEIEPKIGRLLIKIDGGASPVTVRVDGKVVPEAILGLPYPVDPGIRTVVAESPGAPSSEEFVTVAEGQTQEVTLEVLPPPVEPAAPAPPPPPPAAPPPPPPAQPTAERKPAASPWVFVGFGTATAGVLLGSIMGGLSLAKTSDVRDRYCTGTVCDPAAGPALDEANTFANVANVAFVVAALGVGVGVYGLLAGPPQTSPARSARSTNVALPRSRWSVSPHGVRAHLTWDF